MDRFRQRIWKIASICLFLALIAAGIIAKRVFGHPGLVPAFHIPAALVLVWVVQMNKNEKKEAAYDAATNAVRSRAVRGAASR